MRASWGVNTPRCCSPNAASGPGSRSRSARSATATTTPSRDVPREHQEGADLPTLMAHARRGQSSRVRIHRGLVQPPPPALHPRLPLPDRVRTRACIDDRRRPRCPRLDLARERPRRSNRSRSGRDERLSRGERQRAASPTGSHRASSLIQNINYNSQDVSSKPGAVQGAPFRGIAFVANHWGRTSAFGPKRNSGATSSAEWASSTSRRACRWPSEPLGLYAGLNGLG